METRIEHPEENREMLEEICEWDPEHKCLDKWTDSQGNVRNSIIDMFNDNNGVFTPKQQAFFNSIHSEAHRNYLKRKKFKPFVADVPKKKEAIEALKISGCLSIWQHLFNSSEMNCILKETREICGSGIKVTIDIDTKKVSFSR